MIKSHLIKIWTFVLCFSATFLSAQTFEADPWSGVSKQQLADRSDENRVIIPNKYRVVEVDWDELIPLLKKAPLRFSTEADMINVILNLPMPNGETERFKVTYAPVMMTELANKYPEIKTFSGVGLDDPSASIKLDYTPKGFHAMIKSAEHSTVFIDPYATDDNELHISYYKKDFQKPNAHFECGFNEEVAEVEFDSNLPTFSAGDCKLRTYRLALSCTGEYAAFHGGTVAGVMAAYNTSMNRVNGIFETEAGLTMVLVPNTDNLIYLNGATDPFTNGNGGTMLGENISTCNSVIGSANYDIGHVFSTGGGGVAYLNSPCGNFKAGGVTGQGSPVGDPFDVDYVAHEMGHQYGGGHTQNNSCNNSNASSMEPGSASTIMGYAGICAPNVQNNSDDYFHAISIQQMAANIVNGTSSTCPQETVTGNNPPVASAGPNYTIPVSTPFTLTGTVTDFDGDATTHNWDQMDATQATMPPVPTNTAGPAFRSISPTTSTSRTFPNFEAILNNTTPTWEVLPSVGRTMNFRFQVRDNNAGAGCTDEDDMVVTFAGNAGPFTVISPNSGEIWDEGGAETVTWNVANTNAAPVSCANVDIMISTDGGQSWTTLAANVPNDGTHPVTAPNVFSLTARIMIVCSDNIFFDVSDQNFTIGETPSCSGISENNSSVIDIPVDGENDHIITSTINVDDIGTIIDLNVLNFLVTHTWVGDLAATLTSPSGTTVQLFDGPGIPASNFGCDGDNMNVNFDDAAGSTATDLENTCDAAAFTISGTFQPLESLSAFLGEEVNGTWTLTIIDDYPSLDGGSLDGWGLDVCLLDAPLAVELLSFSAESSQRSIDLKWLTSNEINNKGYHVTRSLSPESGFEYIGWVDGLGTPSEYSFIDQDVRINTTYYYQLEQVDFDESVNYSNIVSARIDKDIVLEIYPNPVREMLSIAIGNEGVSNGAVQIMDVNGKLVQKFVLENEQTLLDVDVSNYPSGVYFVELNSNELNEVRKIVVE